jgi:hypothetical protein
MGPAGMGETADVGGSPAWKSGERLTTATVKVKLSGVVAQDFEQGWNAI